MGGNVQAAKLVYKQQPVYPPQMKEAGITGQWCCRLLLAKEGDILNLEVISPEVHPD